MTLGELYDKLEAVELARVEIEKAELAIQHGGSAETMKFKRENLRNREDWLDVLRSERIEL